MKLFIKPRGIGPTSFSEFIRKAPSAKKKRLYATVIERATDRQRSVVASFGTPLVSIKKVTTD